MIAAKPRRWTRTPVRKFCRGFTRINADRNEPELFGHAKSGGKPTFLTAS